MLLCPAVALLVISTEVGLGVRGLGSALGDTLGATPAVRLDDPHVFSFIFAPYDPRQRPHSGPIYHPA